MPTVPSARAARGSSIPDSDKPDTHGLKFHSRRRDADTRRHCRPEHGFQIATLDAIGDAANGQMIGDL